MRSWRKGEENLVYDITAYIYQRDDVALMWRERRAERVGTKCVRVYRTAHRAPRREVFVECARHWAI